MDTVQYENNELRISIKGISPAAKHEGIMRGIVAQLRYQQKDDQVPPDIKEGNTFLLDLLESIIPDENLLRKAYTTNSTLR